MKVGISIPNNWGVDDPLRLIDLAILAERCGFASLWVAEHLINVSYVRARIGDRPYYHPLAMLSAIAARTNRISLGTSVLVMPFHNPFDLAKYIATLDQMSRGRVIMGIGVGNVEEEFTTLGASWERRGALTNEVIEVIRALWTQDAAAYDGATWSFRDVHTSPKPHGGRRVPIWVGGMSMAARRRAVRLGDGWQPTAISPENLREQVGELTELARAASRDPASIAVGMRFNIALDDRPVTPAESLSTIAGYDAGRVLDIARTFAAVGVTHITFALNGHDPRLLEDALKAMATDILPHFG